MSPIPTPVNYAEQVLLEEAERHRLLNSKKQQSVAEAAAATVKLNLADEETFPSLGSAIGKDHFRNFALIYISCQETSRLGQFYR